MPLSFPTSVSPIPASNSFALIGDSRIAAQFNDGTQNTGIYPSSLAHAKTNIFFFNWANALLGQRLYTRYNAGISGYRSDQYLVNLPAAIASGAKWLMIWSVVNDISQSGTTGDTALTIWTRIKNAAQQGLNAGMNVLLLTEPGSNSMGGNATQTGMVFQYNEYLREFAMITPGVFMFDIASFYVDPSQTNLTLRSAYTTDGTHPNAYGGYYLGAAFANFISAYVPPVASQIYSPAEIPANGNIQQLANPLFLTATGGSAGTGISGSVPSGYSCNRAGGATATLSTAADSSGFGNALTIAGTFTAQNDAIEIHQDTTLANYTIPGDDVESGCELVIAAGATNLSQAALTTNFGGTSNPASDLFAGAYVALPGIAMDLVLRAVPFALPGGASWVSWQVKFIGAGAGSFTATIKRPWLRRRFS